MAPFRRQGPGLHRPPLPQLRPAVHEMIGRRLRLHYEDLQQPPLPDRLADLLKQLETIEEPAGPRRN